MRTDDHRQSAPVSDLFLLHGIELVAATGKQPSGQVWTTVHSRMWMSEVSDHGPDSSGGGRTGGVNGSSLRPSPAPWQRNAAADCALRWPAIRLQVGS